MIKLYQNKEWLENKYLEEKLGIHQIGKICGVVNNTIWVWLKRFNTPIRSCSERVHLVKTNHCNLTEHAIQWLNGETMGDATLRSQSQYSASFSYGSKYLEYICYIRDTLKSFGIKQTGKISKRRGEWGSYVYRYDSLTYAELLPIYKHWYPDNGKKIIPREIKLKPLTLRQHYIGDGCLNHPKHGRPYIVLSTDGFTIPDVEWLVKQLIILGFKTTRYPSRNTTAISSHSTKDFLNYIGKCPTECYSYKWDYERF